MLPSSVTTLLPGAAAKAAMTRPARATASADGLKAALIGAI